MKYFFTYLLVLALPFFYCGCSDDDDDSTNPIDELPHLTTTGENTFGCLVNENALVVSNTVEITAIYQGGVLQLGGA